MKIISITVTVRSAVLCMGTMGSCPVVPQANEPHANLCMLYTEYFFILSTDFVGSINTRNICLILSTIYSFISVSVCIDRALSALLWPGPILLIRRPWPCVIHHLHFMNMYRLYIAWYRPILLMYVGCINGYFRNKTLFLWHKRPYFHFTDTGVYYPL
jgi:hypothetical protein